MTGWGQTGPRARCRPGTTSTPHLAERAPHAVGRKGERPVPPPNIAGDFGGGSMFLPVGILAALYERQTSGRAGGRRGDGRRSVGVRPDDVGVPATGLWSDERGTNMLDTGAPYYDTYECSTGATSRSAPSSRSSTPNCSRSSAWIPRTCQTRTTWPAGRNCAALTETVAAHDRDHWARCSPAMPAWPRCWSFNEVLDEPHNTERDIFYDDGTARCPGRRRGSPAPSPATPTAPRTPGEDTEAVLEATGPDGIVPTNQ